VTAAVRRPLPVADDRTVPPTIALTVLTLAVAVGFGRLFSDGSFLGPVVLAALAGHLVAWWCRRNELPTGVAAVATIGAVALVGAWTLLGETTAYGLPLPLTVRRALDVLGGAREQFSTAKAPAEALPGFVLATVLALGVSAFMADWAAFRLQATFEALIPSFTLFLFTSALGAPRYRLWATAAFIAGVLAFLAVHGLARSHRAGAWFGGRPGGGPAAMARTAAVLGAVTLVAGLVVGPRLPGPDAPVVKYKNRVRSGPSNRATVSPLVDIRGRIVDQRDVELFTVRADAPSYWRLTSLDTFDGTIWSSNSTYHDVNGTLRSNEILQPTLDTTELVQEYSISSLSSIWLPAAFRPSRATGVDVSYAGDTASLITPDDTTDGTTYTITSKVPRMTPAILDATPAVAPSEIATKYLELPSDISARVKAEAQRIIAGARTPYAQALALQNHFRTNYRYDLQAGAGHDENTLERFLFQSKSGYCEQFAGVYAVLARLVGLPARVAVGFTPGVYDEHTGLFHVKGGHAHAWAEVYLHGYGWVQFDPTPGRGDPQASPWTGLPAAQDDTLGQQEAAAPTTTVAAGQENADTPTTQPDLGNQEQDTSSAQQQDGGRPAILTLLLIVLGVLALWAITVPALHVRRRTRRRQRPGIAARVLADWQDTLEVLEAAGVVRRPWETMAEYGARAAQASGLQPDPARALRRLAADASIAAYAGADVDEELAVRSAADAAAVRTAVFDQVPMGNRVAWWLDPRPLVETNRRA
jgi:transglutaminase-like putative cysteine protease